MKKIGNHWRVYLIFATVGAFFPVSMYAQTSECTPREIASARVSSSDPVYPDAMELARSLGDRGFAVKCVLLAIAPYFEGQKGAVVYRTDQGSFVAIFLPKTESFSGVKVVEKRRGARYLYSFQGTPRSPAPMDSSKPNFFIKFGNALIWVWGDKELASNLASKFTH
jgi:hypothetical protein